MKINLETGSSTIVNMPPDMPGDACRTMELWLRWFVVATLHACQAMPLAAEPNGRRWQGGRREKRKKGQGTCPCRQAVVFGIKDV
jgi:hypothetical protein